MTAGYSFPDPATIDGSDELRDAFEWQIPETYNIAGTIDPWLKDRPDHTALYHVDEADTEHEFTYRELNEAVEPVAARLAADGITSGDRVAICLPPSPEALALHLAAYRLGAITVPVSVLLGDEAFAHVLETSGAAAVWLDTVATDRFGDAVSAASDVSTTVIDLGGGGYEGNERALGGLAAVTDGASVEPMAETAPDDPAIIVTTSGTSGTPKCVVQAHQYLIGTLPGYQLWFELFGDSHAERVWTPASWAWAGALFNVVFPTLAMGGTVCSRVRRSGFDPGRALAFVERGDISRAFMPPTALRKIRANADPEAFDLDALDVMLCGGEYLPESLEQWAEETLRTTINVSYGLTEANALIGHCEALYPDRADSIGVAYPGHDVDIVDEEGRSVPIGETGEIVLELPDPVAFAGYWDDGQVRGAPGGGPFYTGDIARRDEDGYVYYEGRKDDLIVSSGYRVSPREIETVIEERADVEEAVVGGVADDEFGQRIVAYVVPAAGANAEIDERGLEQRVRDHLGKYKAPHEIRLLREPPQTHSGKIDRGELFSE